MTIKREAMKSEQEQYDRETLLMFYVADELSAEQRDAFERRLASDAQLAAEVRELQAAQRRVDAGMKELDRLQRPPVGDGVATRRAMRAMQQWQTSRMSRLRSPAVVKSLPLPWWMYP